MEAAADMTPRVAAEDTSSIVHWSADPRTNRGVSALLLAGVVAVLVIAGMLTPSPLGWGTHQRLLFAPCLFRVFTGLPCAFCGMTTAFAHMAHGEVRAAFHCHVLGPALYLATWLVGLGALLGLIRGRAPLPAFVLSVRFNAAVLIIVLAAWAVQLLRA